MEEFMNNVDMTDARMVELLTDAMKIDRNLAPINLLFHMSVKICPVQAAVDIGGAGC